MFVPRRLLIFVLSLPTPWQVMEHPAHDLPVTGLGFSPPAAGVALGGYDLLAGSADYKITLFRSQGKDNCFLVVDAVQRFRYS